MFDFRLKVFHATARHLSFSKAAEELFISQPAVSKHVQALEQQYQTKLFFRQGGRISLTPHGEVLLKHAEDIFTLYRKLQYDMNQLINKNGGILRLGASTTLTQYILPKVLAQFHQQYPDIKLNLINGNTQQIETAFIQKEIDLGIIEGRSKNTELKYQSFLKDEIVLVTQSKHPLAQKGEVSLAELRTIPLAIREFGSGTLQVIKYYLKSPSMNLSDLNIQIQLGSTEGIKTYLKNTSCFAFLSLNSILEELNQGIFSVIEFPGPAMSRDFYFISSHGNDEPLANLFTDFVVNYLKA